MAQPPEEPRSRGLVVRNMLLTQALDAVKVGDIEAAQRLIESAEGTPVTLGQVFRLYQAELETQAQQLQESQQRTEQALDWFANLFRTLPVAAILVDAQGLIVDANAHALDELGLQQALRVLPVPLRRLMASLDGELRLAAMLPQVAPGSSAGLDDVALRTLDGRSRWADLRVTQVPPRAGEHPAPQYLCVFNDRTARVEAQRAREAVDAAEYQRDLAQSASRAKTQMLSRVSHELRTPLNAVIGFSHLLLMHPGRLDADSQRKIRHIGDAGQHLLALVDEVLQINRAEAGQLELTMAPVDLRSLAGEVLALQEPMAQSLQLSLQLQAGGEGVMALADARRAREVLTNLVANAVKYNRPGGWVRVDVGGDARQAWVTVSDGGIGMSDEQLAHLFEPFNRLGADRLAVAGHGLGLSIARTLTQAMGGTLEASARPGEGSRFVLQLPRAEPAAA